MGLTAPWFRTVESPPPRFRSLCFGHIYILAMGRAQPGAERAPQGAVASERLRGGAHGADNLLKRARPSASTLVRKERVTQLISENLVDGGR